MNYFMVTYDLNIPGQKYQELIAQLKTHPTQVWTKPLLSCFIIGTYETVDAVYSRIKSVLDGNDHFLVIKVCRPHQGWLPKEHHEWIDQQIPWCG